MNTRFLALFLVVLGFAMSTTSNPATAQPASLNYYPIEENRPDGSIHLRIIEEDQTLRAQQNQISQQVVYDAVIDASNLPIDLPAILKKVSNQNENTAGPNHPTTGGPIFPHTAKPLWIPVKSEWSPADEDAYSTWLAQQTVDFNAGTGLLADCADVGLLFRWVYARNNRLPIANTMSGSGKLFGHFSSNAAWDALPTNDDWKHDERFKAALRYLFNNTYTRTVVADLYPTLVNPSYVRPGSMVMIIRPADGHTQTIHQVDPTGGVTTFWGNEPSAETIYASALIIEIQNKMTLGMWRPVRQVNGNWELTPANQIPGYSITQFSQVFNSNGEMNDWINQQLGVTETDATRLQVLESAFEQGLQMRLQVTAESIPFCVVTQCATTSPDYNNYSTFSRDAKLISEQQELNALIAKLGETDPNVVYFEDQVKASGEVIKGSGLTYLALLQDTTLLPKFNSDPRVSYEARWGIAPATPDPTITFYTLSQALFSLLKERDKMIQNAYETCDRVACTAGSATVKSLSTAHLDSGIKPVFQQVIAAASAAGVDPAAIAAVHAYYTNQGWIFDLDSPACATPGECTMNDLVWGAGAVSHLNAWSPNATDSVNKRWGY